MQLPFESVTTVDRPSDDMLVDMLPEPLMCVDPPGPVVVPDTRPLPALTETPVLAEGGDSPGLSSTTRQFELFGPVADAPGAEDEEDDELLDVWARAGEPSSSETTKSASVFMRRMLHNRKERAAQWLRGPCDTLALVFFLLLAGFCAALLAVLAGGFISAVQARA